MFGLGMFSCGSPRHDTDHLTWVEGFWKHRIVNGSFGHSLKPSSGAKQLAKLDMFVSGFIAMPPKTHGSKWIGPIKHRP